MNTVRRFNVRPHYIQGLLYMIEDETHKYGEYILASDFDRIVHDKSRVIEKLKEEIDELLGEVQQKDAVIAKLKEQRDRKSYTDNQWHNKELLKFDDAELAALAPRGIETTK